MVACNCRRPILIPHLFLILPLTFTSASAAMFGGERSGRGGGTVGAMDGAIEPQGRIYGVSRRPSLCAPTSEQERAAPQSTYPARMCA